MRVKYMPHPETKEWCFITEIPHMFKGRLEIALRKATPEEISTTFPVLFAERSGWV